MTASTYLYERQSEYWTSRQIEEFFFDRGFSVTTLPIPQGVEKLLPADFVFSASSFVKIFGLHETSTRQASKVSLDLLRLVGNEKCRRVSFGFALVPLCGREFSLPGKAVYERSQPT